MSSGVTKNSPMPNTRDTPRVVAITQAGMPSSASGSRSMAAMLAESCSALIPRIMVSSSVRNPLNSGQRRGRPL